ncbi:hypothetical protein J7E88_32915 [Streptomyces sp. ISL-10]|uniref:hypothetical protein n=1 Tax=Streptomyces sp. ISL-10 TaxID=2819172 RepID=UPI001BE7BFE6|nr:hypothetical protein [Streptomyces sp. ISL-10]MBT2369944.1 hypothetical protein [Streptomyces sp. ISL-10]
MGEERASRQAAEHQRFDAPKALFQLGPCAWACGVPDLVAEHDQLVEIGNQAFPALLTGCCLDEAGGGVTVLAGLFHRAGLDPGAIDFESPDMIEWQGGGADVWPDLPP